MHRYTEKLNKLTSAPWEQLIEEKLRVVDLTKALTGYIDRIEHGGSGHEVEGAAARLGPVDMPPETKKKTPKAGGKKGAT